MNKDKINIIREQPKNVSQQEALGVFFPLTYNIMVDGIGVYNPEGFPDEHFGEEYSLDTNDGQY